MRQNYYEVRVWNGFNWVFAQGLNCTRQCALGILNQFAMQYPSRLYCGPNSAKLIAKRSPKGTPAELAS